MKNRTALACLFGLSLVLAGFVGARVQRSRDERNYPWPSWAVHMDVVIDDLDHVWVGVSDFHFHGELTISANGFKVPTIEVSPEDEGGGRLMWLKPLPNLKIGRHALVFAANHGWPTIKIDGVEVLAAHESGRRLKYAPACENVGTTPAVEVTCVTID